MEQLGGKIPWADIGLPAEWAHCDGVFVQSGQIVAQATVHVPSATKLWWNYAREYWDPRACQ